MAFDDLTSNQIKTLTLLIEALNSGNYSDEFVMTMTLGREFHTIHLYDKGKLGVSSNHKIEGFTSTDIQTLKDEGYIVMSGRGLASLKAKAFQQYKQYKELTSHHNKKGEEMQNEQSPPLIKDKYLRSLIRVYEATEGSQRKIVNLEDLLSDEGWTRDEIEDITDYMIGENWIKPISDETLDARITHAGIKAAKAALPSTSFNQPLDTKNEMSPLKATLQDWAGAKHTSQAMLALVFTDIVGSTNLSNKYGDKKWVEILMSHFAKARYYRDLHKGFEIKLIGDACMVAFRTAAEALQFALDFVHDTGHEEIILRVGIHVGQVRIIDDDIYGRMVNYTSRVQHTLRSGEPGIVLSDAAKEEAIAELGEEAGHIMFSRLVKTLPSFGEKVIWQVTVKFPDYYEFRRQTNLSN